MDNKICNTKVEVPTGMGLNDKDYISSFNSCLKEMTKNYANVMAEASNKKLFEVYKGIFTDLSSLQREAFELMFRNGWYCLESSDRQKIKEKFDTLSKEYQDMMQ